MVKCPLCGKTVEAPEAKPFSRLLCRKCHTPFHLDKAGAAVVGEPPDVEGQVQELRQKLQRKLERVPMRPLIAGLSGFLVLVLGLYVLLRPADHLKGVAEKAAQAFADDDLAYLKSIAASGTGDDVARWFNEAHPRLVQERERWYGKEVVEVHVAREDLAGRKGSVGVSIHPVAGTGHDVSLADPTAATAAAITPFDLGMEWTLERWGGWKLDGRETYAKAHPTR